MQQIPFEEGLDQAFNSLNAGRLALLIGAGLSMADPTNLRSAAQIALDAKTKYDGIHGADRAPLSPRIEEQAQFFFERGELATVYLRTFVDPHEFAGPPNKGHYAVADLLLTRAIQMAVTTGVLTAALGLPPCSWQGVSRAPPSPRRPEEIIRSNRVL